MKKYLYFICIMILSCCKYDSNTSYYNYSSNAVNVKMERFKTQNSPWISTLDILKDENSQIKYKHSYLYTIEISLDSQTKAYNVMNLESPSTFYIYDNGFVFSVYDKRKSQELIEKYKIKIIDGKKNIIFSNSRKDQIYFHPFNTSSLINPIYLYDKNALYR